MNKKLLARIASMFGVVFYGMAVLVLLIVSLGEWIFDTVNPAYNDPGQVFVFGLVALGFGFPTFIKVWKIFFDE